LTDKKQENQDNPSGDELLKRMLKMKPKPHKPAPAGANSKGPKRRREQHYRRCRVCLRKNYFLARHSKNFRAICLADVGFVRSAVH
jgi:hypothetical protein